MVDGDEQVHDAALRELKEEAGYVGKVISTNSEIPLAYEPGLTSSRLNFVHVEIDGDAPENLLPKPEPEEDEFIEVIMIRKDNLYIKLLEIAKAKNALIDCKLATFAYALYLKDQYNF